MKIVIEMAKQWWRRLKLAVEWFVAQRMSSYAAALTYSTLLAIVPIMAVVFAIARGFGYNRYIESWFRDTFSSQPQAAEVIIGFVNSYLVHTKSGLFLGIGLLFMLWTVLMLTSNIEQAFNEIWQVKHPRSFFRTITDYMAMFLLVPIFIVVTSGISIMVATFANEFSDYFILSRTVWLLLDVSPYVLMSAAFIALYVFMPNTRVKLKHALVPGILSGVAMQLLQLFYINSQIWVSSYNAIYGSFAALPLFMLWLQISWTICLFGAELCYTNQNLDDYATPVSPEDLSHWGRQLLSVVVMNRICSRFDKGEKAYTAEELKQEMKVPMRVLKALLYDLVDVNLLTEVTGDEKGQDSRFQPAVSLSRLSVGMLLDRLDAKGKHELELEPALLDLPVVKKTIKNKNRFLSEQRNLLLSDLELSDPLPAEKGKKGTKGDCLRENHHLL